MIKEIQIGREEILYENAFIHCLQDTILFAEAGGLDVCNFDVQTDLWIIQFRNKHGSVMCI